MVFKVHITFQELFRLLLYVRLLSKTQWIFLNCPYQLFG